METKKNIKENEISKEQTTEQLTPQAKERALLQVTTNWQKLKPYVTVEDHDEVTKKIASILEKHIKEKYGL